MFLRPPRRDASAALSTGWSTPKKNGNATLGLKKILSPSPCARAASEKRFGWIDYRDIALFELAYSCGVRVSELVSIDEPARKESLGSLSLEKMEVEVFGKGAKWRRLPIGEKAKNAIEVWLKYREQAVFDRGSYPSDRTPLFVNRFGKRLSVRGVQRRFSIHSTQSSSRLSITPHMLRHSFASHILQSSKNLRAVQELLGHANVTSTQIYTKLDYQSLSEVYDKSHPRAKKK